MYVGVLEIGTLAHLAYSKLFGLLIYVLYLVT